MVEYPVQSYALEILNSSKTVTFGISYTPEIMSRLSRYKFRLELFSSLDLKTRNKTLGKNYGSGKNLKSKFSSEILLSDNHNSKLLR